jgi:hypothetical protein
MKKRTNTSTWVPATLQDAADNTPSGGTAPRNTVLRTPEPTDGVANAVAVLARVSTGAVHQVRLDALEHGAVRAMLRAMFRDRVPVFADPLPGLAIVDPAPLLESELIVEVNKPPRKRAAKSARKATKK